MTLTDPMKTEEREFREQVAELLASNDDQKLSEALADTRAADIAECFELISDEDRSRLLYALPPHTAAEVIIMLDEAVRGEVVDDLDTVALTEIVSELPPDDAADVLGELSARESDEILEQMPVYLSNQMRRLLEYDDESAGGIMTPDVVAVPETATVKDAVGFVQEAKQHDELNDIYIVDAARKLVGTVPLRRLVTNPPHTLLSDICERDTVAVYATDDQETVVQIIRKYDALEAAVIDESGRLLGRITHDDLLDVADEEAEEDLLRMAGTDAAELDTHSAFHAARIRLTWLLPCMFGMLLSATVLNLSAPHFDLALFASLALFVPMIGATGGNSGVQISTVIVRGFATGDLGSRKLIRTLLREGRIALAMAPVCGIFAWALVNLFFPLFSWLDPAAKHLANPGHVALAVGSAMISTIAVSAGLGIALPFSFRRLGVDPAIASGPLVTTLNDVVSVSIYMTMAILMTR